MARVRCNALLNDNRYTTIAQCEMNMPTLGCHGSQTNTINCCHDNKTYCGNMLIQVQITGDRGVRLRNRKHQAHKHTHARTHTHTHTCTRMHTHARTHAHTSTLFLSPRNSLLFGTPPQRHTPTLVVLPQLGVLVSAVYINQLAAALVWEVYLGLRPHQQGWS